MAEEAKETTGMRTSSPRPREGPNTTAAAATTTTMISPAGTTNRERSRSVGGQAHVVYGYSSRSPSSRRSLPTSPLLQRLRMAPLTSSTTPPFVPALNVIPPSSPGAAAVMHTPPPPPLSPASELSSLQHRKQTAIRHALEQERARTAHLEQTEADMAAEELKKALKRERQHSARLASDLAALRVENVQGQAEAEINEEGRINGLMRRLECLQKEKGRIIVELEREEEMLTNTLQKKLNEVRREKMLLERQIEQEHLHTDLLRSNNALAAAAAAADTPSSSNTTSDNSNAIQHDLNMTPTNQHPPQTQILPDVTTKQPYSKQTIATLPSLHDSGIELKEEEEEEHDDDNDCGEQIMLEDLAGIHQHHHEDEDDDNDMMTA